VARGPVSGASLVALVGMNMCTEKCVFGWQIALTGAFVVGASTETTGLAAASLPEA
jgi:hypothetical protein